MRIIGLDIHRAFAEAVAWDDGKLRRLGRVDTRRDLLAAFAEQLSSDDVVVVEATGNASAVAAVLAPHVKKVVIESYVWARPSLHAKKLRDLELKAGYKAARGQKGAAHAYNIKSHR